MTSIGKKRRLADSALAPHAFLHRLEVGSYYVVRDHVRGNEVVFRQKYSHAKLTAIAEIKRRGFTPLYRVNVRIKI